MTEIPPKKVSRDIPKFNIGADLMSYASCGRRYRYYNLFKFPQSDKSNLWNSEFILSVEHEAYRRWEGGCREVSIQMSNNINERVCSYLTSKGMETDKRLFKQSQDTVPDYIMNKRSYEVLMFLITQFYPLVSDHDVTLNEYCDGDNPASITDTCGIMRVSVLMECSESNPVAKMILSGLPGAGEKSEVIFIFKGMEQPLSGVDNFTSRSHITHLNASMAIRDRNNRQKGSETTVAGGVLIYLNEFWLSDDRIRNISAAFGDDGMITRDYLQQPDILYNSCFKIVPYNTVNAGNALAYLKSVSVNLSNKINLTNSGKTTMDIWSPGMYNESRCSVCDFRYSCGSVPEDKKIKPGY